MEAQVFRPEPFPNLSRVTNANRLVVGPIEVPAYVLGIGVTGVVIGGGGAALGAGFAVAHGGAPLADLGVTALFSLFGLVGVWLIVMGVVRWRWKSEFERVVGRPPHWGHEGQTRIPVPGDPERDRFGNDRWTSPEGIAKRSRAGATFFTWCGGILVVVFAFLVFVTFGVAGAPGLAGRGIAIGTTLFLTASAAICALLCFLRARRLRRWARDMDDVIAHPGRRIDGA